MQAIPARIRAVNSGRSGDSRKSAPDGFRKSAPDPLRAVRSTPWRLRQSLKGASLLSNVSWRGRAVPGATGVGVGDPPLGRGLAGGAVCAWVAAACCSTAAVGLGEPGSLELPPQPAALTHTATAAAAANPLPIAGTLTPC